jgi:hypothetical protein
MPIFQKRRYQIHKEAAIIFALRTHIHRLRMIVLGESSSELLKKLGSKCFSGFRGDGHLECKVLRMR